MTREQLPLRLEALGADLVQNVAAWGAYAWARASLARQNLENTAFHGHKSPRPARTLKHGAALEDIVGPLNADANEVWLFHLCWRRIQAVQDLLTSAISSF